jgi:hypothetical protein
MIFHLSQQVAIVHITTTKNVHVHQVISLDFE